MDGETDQYNVGRHNKTSGMILILGWQQATVKYYSS